MEITDLLLSTDKNGASDLHLSSGKPPLMRVNGDMLPLNAPPMRTDDVKQMLYSIMTEQQRSEYERDYELDFSIAFGEDLRFRVNAFNTIDGPAAVFRTIPTKVLTLDELGAPSVFKRLCHLNKGLILVTGPTGSGKSTTLAAMVDYINTNFAHHILTVEDPVEFVHHTKSSLINQREVGSSTKSFARALKSALREDPDVILVGELRDLETIQLAMTAAETGHLVMGTLHTNSAPKTIDRIIDVFPASDKEMIRAMLSVSLEAVIAQTLVKRADNSGRIAAHEILLGTSAVRNLIREGKIPQIYSMMQMGSKVGMTTMKESIYHLLDEGAISPETAKEALATSVEDDKKDEGRRGSAQQQQPQGF
ncbi:MAG: twitching motility protein PilT [Rickettsiales bacterium]|nr:twitching motility protein PilT [Rickettsiales bacterium]|tara:strand:- start:385 stop:1479 length:1095 start_codon:yes stop_codon:yes gene_type:complete